MATTRYVGIGGNDSNDGLSWANRKLTLNGVEDTPVQAGDTVYVGAGTYRSASSPMLTCDVDGSAGSPISYIGDYDGSHTDGVGGVVRLTGSAADEKSYLRGAIINGTNRNYRTFIGFQFDGMVNTALYFNQTSSNIVIQKCIFLPNNGNSGVVYFVDAPSDITITDCIFKIGYKGGTNHCIYLVSTNEVNDKTFTISNCILSGGAYGVYSTRCGNVAVKNCVFDRTGARTNAVNTSYPMTVNNCLIIGTSLYAAVAGQLVEDYNNFDACDVARTNVATGAHSLAYPINFDARWAQELLWFNGTMVTPFDLASYSALIDVAGTTPTTADLRGTTKQGTERELGALEYDSTLDIEAGSGTGGGAVSIQPIFGRLG